MSGEDVSTAVRLGTDGILVASSAVKVRERRGKLKELASAMAPQHRPGNL